MPAPRSRKGRYAGRPGPSAIVATAFAAGLLRRRDRVLDVGCGDGRDALALARWGVREVTGVDADPDAIADARRAAREAEPDVRGRTRWRTLSVFELSRAFKPRAFNAVVDTLLMNNLPEEDYERYAYQVARVLKPRGLLIATWRVDGDALEKPPPVLDVRELEPYFKWGPIVPAHLPERPARRRDPHHAQVAVVVARKR